MRSCWECEVEVDLIVVVILPGFDGDGPIIGLCPTCFQDVYLTLVDSLQDDVEERASHRAAVPG